MSLIKNVVTVGGWTMAYRLSSIIRDAVQANILGTTIFADAFNLAFKFANVLRKLFAEGSFNASFLPIFSNAMKDKGQEEAQKIASQVLTWLVFLVSFIMIICLIFFRYIIHGYAPGIETASEKFDHLVNLGRICSPYIAASFLVALFGGVLNTINRFAMPAATQLVLNICVIIALFTGALCFPSTAYTMAWATFLGGVIQVAILWGNVRMCGLNIGFDLSAMTDEVKQFFKKLISGAIGAGVWQLNVLIDFMVLSFLPTGAVSYFYYMDHVNQIPVGILGIAFSTALLPPLTKAVHAKDSDSAQKQMNLGLLFAFVFTLPAAILFISLNEPITAAMYGRGNFGPEQVAAAAPALAAFAIGLPSYMVTKVLTTTFFAHKDTKTPLNGGVISIVTNLLFIILLMPAMKHTGIALATSLSAWCNVIYLLFTLKKLGTVRISCDTVKECLKQLVVSGAMWGLIFLMNIYYANSCYIIGGSTRNFVLLAVMGVGIIGFCILGKCSKMFAFLSEIKNLEKTEKK
ncbi:MAG: murein biosynthesis integral membrane protein MurJ [Holosporaceae bacterium]|jgi:putative peptidoglycan lipid II flippase|nr:murein biosynthesis integral membrane protein MurJ [Holosporaceae bacterium]